VIETEEKEKEIDIEIWKGIEVIEIEIEKEDILIMTGRMDIGKEKEWRVDIEVNPIDASDINMTELVKIISEIAGLDEDSVEVGVEMNDAGEIVRVVIYVNEETTASGPPGEKT